MESIHWVVTSDKEKKGKEKNKTERHAHNKGMLFRESSLSDVGVYHVSMQKILLIAGHDKS